jgi:5-hydroxyisourate hydrolase
MKGISTHILDIAQGKPARDVAVRLEKQNPGGDWRPLSSARTDQDGRCARLLADGEEVSAGVYRLIFETGAYHAAAGVDALYPVVEVSFRVRPGESHFHIPLLLSPNGYTTYRGA